MFAIVVFESRGAATLTCEDALSGNGMNLEDSSLGKPTKFVCNYDPKLLFPISRRQGRDDIGIGESTPFFGVDVWNAYEISWLDRRGKPHVAVGTFVFPASSTNLIESKSLKLYLGSFSGTQFESREEVTGIIKRDLCEASGANVSLRIAEPPSHFHQRFDGLTGTSLDDLEVETDVYLPDPSILVAYHDKEWIAETLISDLLKSNCPMTGQPDWASLQIQYAGPPIDHSALLRYIVSYRDHAGFHEQCVEQIFVDILTRCKPEKLAIYARYTRRGGLDINPFRSNFSPVMPENPRTARQ